MFTIKSFFSKTAVMAESETDSPSIVETTTAKTTASELKNDTTSSKAETDCSSSLSFAALFPKSEDSEKETMATMFVPRSMDGKLVKSLRERERERERRYILTESESL